MKIKVCGLRDAENIKAIAALKPDYMGFICYSRSPRFIADMPAEVLNLLPQGIIKTGVFVNAAKQDIDTLIAKYAFGAIQLHGSESPEFCSDHKGKVTVIKAFGVDDDFDFEQLNAYQNSVDYFMFDTKTVQHGGSGKVFNWAILDKYKLDVPFFLSGGLSLDNLAEVKQITHPAFYAVDLNSRFEIEPGLKDINRLKQAFELLR
ncbi:phosphoribosylanthranilate isomerase [Mucilaginibacter sp. HMF5004]|uniref:phosphoribosylanthranilate isomerase n=1 Tax=Mucilaginibacter rivuli TaxID=2857527 RepID=UPI001C60325D|nr:phosphoribosylanthranilate isomerase [Mucilaginibacter rivuli]MBW4891463.1 phosphoribosylanthranilate isomerase [Mucilaginibacter rivuli]